MHSQMPPWWLAAGGIESQRDWCLSMSLCWAYTSQDFKASLSSRLAPTKLIPLSLSTIASFPRRPTNRLKAKRNEDVSNEMYLVQIVSTIYEIYPQNRHLVLFWFGFDSQCPLIDNHVSNAEVESRTHGSRPRRSTQKKSEAKAKDSLSKDRHSRSQRQECSRPLPSKQAQVLSKKKGLHKNFSGDLKKKTKVFTKIFQAISTKNVFQKNFLGAPQNCNNSKNSVVLEQRTGQFSRTWGFDAKDLTFEAKDFKMCPQGLHLWSNEFATSKCAAREAVQLMTEM